MKKLLIAAAMAFPAVLPAQNAITSDLVEGGKTLVELIRVIRAPRVVAAVSPPPETKIADSCVVRKIADISFKNKTGKPVQVSLFFRIGNNYDTRPLMLTLSALSQESLFELRTGIYKYKIETGEEDEQVILHEGELKLEPCDRLIREIK